ncbi:MAG: group II intron reverse transcriptase/maturase, partial [Bdellovibrionales bacterium]|nr:group II intron reverse transcriptase/maturase [Bdellovibrionales bacterium]
SEREPGKRFTKLWRVMTSKEWLIHAWQRIEGNKGSHTAGIDNETADDISCSRIVALSERLRAGTYKPKAVRRVYIPKGNGKRRPLGIRTIEDRIVQQALRMLLEPIFEADFLDCSHGFRKHRSTHTALREVAVNFPRTSWTVEGDIVGCFDNIPHEKLVKAVSRRVADGKILSLIRRFLKAGYMEDWMYHRTYSGTPQGGVISPLLCNIFLHALDDFMVRELGANRRQTSKDSYARKTHDYKTTSRELWKRRVKLRRACRSERRQLLAEVKELEKLQKRTPCYDKRHPAKFGYVRYADDFVILVNGTRADAEAVKAQVADKLKTLGLELSEEKTTVTHWRNKFTFLGFNIQGRMRKKGVQIKAIFSIPNENFRRIRREIEKVCSYHHIPEADAMARVSLMYRGWCNYYRFASGPQTVFSRLSYFAWWQFAHFLARKHQTSIAQVIRRAKRSGRLKSVTVQGRQLQTFAMQVGKQKLILNIVPPKTGSIWNVPKPANWNGDQMPPAMTNWAKGRSLETQLTAKGRTGGLCERCGQRPVFEVHHRRPMRGKSLRGRVTSDAAQRQTAVGLCLKCRAAAHGYRAAG